MYVGIDLAWGTRGRTGLAVCDHAGRLVSSGVARTDADIDAWLASYASAPVCIAVDAPLVVPNATGMRECEREMGRHFGRFKASAHASSRANPRMNPPRAEVLARRHGWDVDPVAPPTTDRPVCLEVYPHAAMIGLFGLSERILYKRKARADRPQGFRQLLGHLGVIPELGLDESPRWAEIVRIVERSGRGDLTRIEDEIDAILCAHVAWLWCHRPKELKVYGSLEEGYIVSPPPPHAFSSVGAGRDARFE